MFGRGDRTGPEREERGAPGEAQRGDRLADVHRVAGEDGVTLDLELHHVGQEPRIDPGRDSRSKVPALSRRGEEHGAIAARLDPGRDGRRVTLWLIEREALLFDQHDQIGAITRERSRGRGDSRTPEEQRVDLPAGGLSRLACRRHQLEGDPAQGAVPGLGDHQDVAGHAQITFASSWSNRTSSGTASAPSPTMRPPARSGGAPSSEWSPAAH